MKSFHFKVNSQSCPAKSKLSFSLSWRFKFSLFICGVTLMTKCKSQCDVRPWFLTIWQVLFEEILNGVKRTANLCKTLSWLSQQPLAKNAHWIHCLLSTSPHTRDDSYHYIYILNSFNNSTHDSFTESAFRNWAQIFSKHIRHWNKTIRHGSASFWKKSNKSSIWPNKHTQSTTDH